MQLIRLLVLAALVAAVAGSFTVHTASATVPGANGKIAFGGGDIFVVDPDGTNLVNLTRTGTGTPDYAPQWSPTGDSIVFESTANRDIYLTNATGTSLEGVAWTSMRETLPSWAPDGKHVVFTAGWAPGDGDLMVWSRYTGQASWLIGLPGEEAGAVYSPDGKTIAFTSTDDTGSSNIYAVGAAGSGLRRLTTSGRDAQPDFSPDGGKIVFASKRNGTSALYVMNADGTAQTRLSPPSADAYESPAWAPNGAKLVYVRSRGGVASIWTMNADGSGETKVLTTQNAFPTPHWQPVGFQPLGDVTPPSVSLKSPADGAVFARGEVVTADYACADEPGGSELAACSASTPNGGRIDTSIGRHAFTVTARDYAGHVTSVTHTYTTFADTTRPTLVLRNLSDGATFLVGEELVVDFTCVDEDGGSGIQRCWASALGAGNRLDTTYAGRHAIAFFAQDRAGNWTQLVLHYSVALSAGNPRQRLQHLRDVLAAKDALLTLPRKRWARARLARTLASLELALQPDRWRADGTLRPDARGLAGLTAVKQVAAHFYWGEESFQDAVAEVAPESIMVMRALAYARFNEVRTFVGGGGAPSRFTLWRAERHLQTADEAEQPMRSTPSYIAAWQALIGLPPCC